MIPLNDKVLHLIAGLLIAHASSAIGCNDAQAISNAVIIGALKELADTRKPGGFFDWQDLAATAIGGSLVGIRIRF